MRLPRAHYCKPDFIGLGNRFLDVFLPGGATSCRSRQKSWHAPRPAALRFPPPEPLVLDGVRVSDKRDGKETSDFIRFYRYDDMTSGLWDGKGLDECSLP